MKKDGEEIKNFEYMVRVRSKHNSLISNNVLNFMLDFTEVFNNYYSKILECI